MLTLLTVIALLLLAIAAPLWGADSRDGSDSAEYERRRNWRGTRWRWPASVTQTTPRTHNV